MKRTFVVVALLFVAACSPADQAQESAPVDPTTTTTVAKATTTTRDVEMTITSPAFADLSAIPAEYTCDGADVSPELEVSGLPTGTRTVAIIVDDPDAPLGTWDHWVEFDIESSPGDFVFPRDTGSLGVPGNNSWHITGYKGPCPPEGEEHTYFFTVFALDTSLELPEGVDSETVREAMVGHTLDSVILRGTYSR